MSTVFLFEPHADDMIISKAIAAAHYLGAGIKVHLVTMSPSGSGSILPWLDGSVTCGWHGYHHDPVREGYTPPVEDDFHDLRLNESRAALGTLASAITGSGGIEHHDGGLPTAYGGPYGGPPTADGIAAAKAVIKQYVDEYADGTTFFHTMSPTDDHPDHAACGHALRELKNDPAYAYLLGGSRFFVSRLYWGAADAVAEGLTPFPYTTSRKAEYDRAIRLAAKCYAAWQPNHGVFGVGYHQVINQFYQNGLDSQGNGTPSSPVVIESKWHD